MNTGKLEKSGGIFTNQVHTISNEIAALSAILYDIEAACDRLYVSKEKKEVSKAGNEAAMGPDMDLGGSLDVTIQRIANCSYRAKAIQEHLCHLI